MKRTASVLAAWLLSFGIQTGSAARVEPAQLPSPVHIDTEISTNCILRIGDGVSRTFAFTLDFDATPSNNVQIAFGHDADTDGVLSIEETGMTIGWDCGTWFVNGYDHRNRSVQKNVKRRVGGYWANAETHTFVWDGNNIVLKKVEYAIGIKGSATVFFNTGKLSYFRVSGRRR